MLALWIHRKTDFTDKRGCSYNEPIAVKGTLSISTAIPVQEENISAVAGQLKEWVIDIDAERVPSGLMHLALRYRYSSKP